MAKSVSGLTIPSVSSLMESMRIGEMSEKALAEDYLSYPEIPYKELVQIDKIGIINYDCVKKEPLGILKYKTFREAKPDMFPACKDPKNDYEDDEQVSPAVIVSGEKKYRVNQNLWFPLSDVAVGIMRKQGQTGRKLLPIKVIVDKKDQWLVPLFNLVRK